MQLAEVRIDAVDVGIAAASVAQALPLPDALAAPPRRTGALAGVVDHGGVLVPVVDLARWVGTGERQDGPHTRILILRDGARMLGLRVSAVGGLVDVAPDRITRLHHDDDADEVFHSVARSPETGRVLSVLDVGRLAALACAWHGGAPTVTEAPPPPAARDRHTYAVLDAGTLRLGVPAGVLAEVIAMPSRTAIGDGAWCTWRGRHLAIVPPAAVDLALTDDGAGLLAVLEHDGLALGVPVRATLHLADFVPAATVYDDDGAEVRLVDVAALFARRPEAGLSRSAHAAAPTPAGAGKPNDAAYVVFDADGLAATPLDALERVLPLLDTPGATMRWGDAAIPVVDLRRPGHAPAEEGQVLIVRAGERRAACVVARVHVMIPAGGGQIYRLGAGAFIATDDGRERASYRTVDLTTYC
ncbi:chemotaxis protein CheW [Telluria mixta]|uniref:Chemotaxis protein CheW n=1 Tax=Telluria mixta TaxID=34071 RepID=A0ABT2BU18_9BURK|nr:chemotaxis protein CheW [Telluria mixta]MCS0628620.1 chemotaxis protein CheW [Telluria mixta]WEM93278.1 chemotaxis protein CheW [Telluria mixta]